MDGGKQRDGGVEEGLQPISRMAQSEPEPCPSVILAMNPVGLSNLPLANGDPRHLEWRGEELELGM